MVVARRAPCARAGCRLVALVLSGLGVVWLLCTGIYGHARLWCALPLERHSWGALGIVVVVSTQLVSSLTRSCARRSLSTPSWLSTSSPATSRSGSGNSSGGFCDVPAGLVSSARAAYRFVMSAASSWACSLVVAIVDSTVPAGVVRLMPSVLPRSMVVRGFSRSLCCGCAFLDTSMWRFTQLPDVSSALVSWSKIVGVDSNDHPSQRRLSIKCLVSFGLCHWPCVWVRNGKLSDKSVTRISELGRGPKQGCRLGANASLPAASASGLFRFIISLVLPHRLSTFPSCISRIHL